MACLDIIKPNSTTVVKAYDLYRQFIKVGYAVKSKEAKELFNDLRVDYKYGDCDECKEDVTCTKGCYTEMDRCNVSIDEYIEIKNCITNTCINIEEIQ